MEEIRERCTQAWKIYYYYYYYYFKTRMRRMEESRQTHVPVFPERRTLDLFSISRDVPKSESIALGLKKRK
jgi:hypothetical protein